LVAEQKRKRILIMDDEVMVGEIACQMLDYLGYEAKHVLNGDEAIREYGAQFTAGNRYDAVLMDLTIPGGMGGQEAVIKILELDKDARVFVSSGHSTDPIMTNFQKYGFTGAIAKPFDLAAIESMLAKLL